MSLIFHLKTVGPSMKIKIFTAFVLHLLMFLPWAPAGFALATDMIPQNNSPARWFTESGLLIGYGTSNIADGRHYEPILLIWQLSKDLRPYWEPLKKHQGSLSFIFEPQLNLAFNPRSDVEFGIGLGLKYTYPLMDRLHLYILGSTGPHYMALQTDEQASGFIFADTVGVGLSYRLTPGSAISLGYRYRHLSNAGLKSPNSGVNTQFFTIGYSAYF